MRIDRGLHKECILKPPPRAKIRGALVASQVALIGMWFNQGNFLRPLWCGCDFGLRKLIE
jgi:hypothetical protein